MLDNHGVGTAHHKATRYFTFVYRSRFHASSCLDIYSLIIHHHLFVNGVLLFAELTTNHTFLHRPWQTTLVGFKTTSHQFLLFGERGLRCRLLADDIVNLLIERSHAFLFLLQLLGQCLLFTLELV